MEPFWKGCSISRLFFCIIVLIKYARFCDTQAQKIQHHTSRREEHLVCTEEGDYARKYCMGFAARRNFSLYMTDTLLIISQHNLAFFSQPSHFAFGCLNLAFSFVPTAISKFTSWLVCYFLMYVLRGGMTPSSWSQSSILFESLKSI